MKEQLSVEFMHFFILIWRIHWFDKPVSGLNKKVQCYNPAYSTVFRKCLNEPSSRMQKDEGITDYWKHGLLRVAK